MEKLYIVLLGILQSEPDDSVDYLVANYILNHKQDFNDLSTEQLAKACGVSKASISRFCRRVGLHDFYELKKIVSQCVPNPHKYHYEVHSDQEYFLDQYLDSVQYHLTRFKNQINYEDINDLVEDIHRYPNVILAGNLQANHICMTLQYNLLNCEKLTQVKVKFSNLTKLIENSDENTLLVVFSSTGRFFERLYRPKTLKPIPEIYLITLSALQSHFPFVYRIIHLHDHSDFVSGTLELQLIADMIAITYNEKYTSNTFTKTL